MATQTKVRRTVNTKGVKKSKITDILTKKNILDQLEKLLPKNNVAYLYKISEQCFHLFTKLCCDLSFIQISFYSDPIMKLTVKKTAWELVTHYSVLLLQILRMLHIFLVSTTRIFGKVKDLTTFLCIGSLLGYVVGFCASSSLLFRPHETAQLVNTTPLLLTFYHKNGKVPNMFHNAKNATFIIALAVISVGCPLLLSAFGFLVEDLPVSLYHILESITGRPTFLPHFLWKLLTWPVELLMFLHTIMLACYACMILLTLPNMGLLCTNPMRMMRVNSLKSWMKLRQKYYLAQVYASAANSWIKFMIVPGIFSISCTIIIFIYVTLRHTDIPMFIYCGFPSIGFSLLVLMFWFGFEVITFVRSTKGIVGTLNNQVQPYFLELPPMERLYLTKYGKATRQMVFNIGDFTHYSIGVPMRIWNEILNQLLFLLTL